MDENAFLSDDVFFEMFWRPKENYWLNMLMSARIF
jgi:hypothetical protein